MPAMTDIGLMREAKTMAESWGANATENVRYGVLPKDRRREIFGLECPDQLEWRNWTPGTEYSKNYVLKNVSTSVLNITYKQTASKSFSMDFPEPFRLRPGMSCPLKVIFRPLKLQQYSDHIEIFCNNSSFIVLVEAYTPATHIEVASQLDFGFVPNKEQVNRFLVVKNTGDVEVGLSWKLEAPFGIEPTSARIAPGRTASFDVSFMPMEACSYNVNALCQLDSGISTTVQILGIGKFPYLSIEHSSIDFGPVLVGKTVERSFRFGNHSMVDANFSVEQSVEGSNDGVYTITPTKGTLGPDEYTLMRVVYSPKHTGTYSSEDFIISTAGGNKLTLNLRGSAIGPHVTLSAMSFNYGNVPSGQTPSRVLYMQNHSDVPVVYDWQLDAEDCFAMSRPRGIIPPQTTGHVTVTFHAPMPANYWKRVACLIKDADPLSLDLLATAFDEKSRPPPFATRHIEGYINRVASGGAPVDVDPITVSIPPSVVGSFNGGISRPDSANASSDHGSAAAPLMTGGLGVVDPAASQQALVGPTSWQLLFEGQDPAQAITLDTSTLDFGTCSRLSASEHKTVTVTNNTSTKIAAFFSIPGWHDPGASGPAKLVFQVFPESADIKAGGSASFRIAFRPTKDAQHYSQLLHLRASMKSMRNFRLVPDNLVVPPWSVPLQACGNTFLHTNPEFAPKVELTHKSVTFPPCRTDESIHQTVMIVNYGDTPSSFAFQTTGLVPIFTIKPAQGVVPAKGNVLVGLRFSPRDEKPVNARTTCTFNGVAMTAVPLVLSGAAFAPRLAFDVPGTFFFRPTCLGASSQRSLTIRNPSRVPAAFRWHIPAKLDGIMSVTPASGVLRGNESFQVVWSFAPGKQKTYDHKLTCLLYDPADEAAATAAQIPPLPSSTLKSSSGLAPAVSIRDDEEPSDRDEVDKEEGQIAFNGGATNALSSEVLSAPADPLPRGVDRVHLHVVGEGTAGALAMNPPSLDFGTLPVGHAVTRSVTLLNQSDGVLRYRVDCGPAEGADGDGTREPESTPVEFPQAGLSSVEPKPGLEVWVDEPEGAIPAKASKVITVTFFPRFRKQYRLQLRCRTSTVAPLLMPTARPPSVGNTSSTARAVLPPLLIKQRSLNSSSALPIGASTPLGATDNAIASNWPESSTPAICSLSASVVFPRPMITDVFLEGIPKQVAWDMMGIRDINGELQKQVTELELELNQMESIGSLTTEVAVRALQPFKLDFGTHPVQGRPCVLSVEISNATDLPVHWELNSSDATGLEMENWVEPGRPRNEAEKATDFILENHIFEVHPHSGLLERRGSRATITLTYCPSHSGDHRLPVFLRIKDGKRVQLQLCGSTVHGAVQRLVSTPAQRLFTFDPTPIVEASPPLHTYLLRNGGPGEVKFTLDLSVLKKLAEESWGFEVIKLRSEASGTVPDLGASPLNWVFTPLEARAYSVQIPVLLGDSSVEIITLQGRGFHPAFPKDSSPLPGEGSRNWADWQGFSTLPKASPTIGRLATLCHDVLSLGTTLPEGISRRIVMVSNTSQYPLAFGWDLGIYDSKAPIVSGSGSAVQAGLSITPRSGMLEPGSQCICRITLEAGITPQLFEAEVKCHVRVDEEAATRYLTDAMSQQSPGDSAHEFTDSGSVIEEVIDLSPDKRTRAEALAAASKRRPARFPLHLYMTTAIRMRIKNLDMQYSKLIDHFTDQRLGSLKAPELPEPQVIALGLSGRILTKLHIEAGTFIPSHELEASRQLLKGTAWAPPAARPFWEKLHDKPCHANSQTPTHGGEQPPDGTSSESVVLHSEPASVPSIDEVLEEKRIQPQEAGEVREGDLLELVSNEGASLIPALASVEVELNTEGDEALPSDTVLSLPEDSAEHPKQFSKGWRPLPAPPEAPIALPSSITLDGNGLDQQAAGHAALAVLKGILADALDPGRRSPVVGAWDCLKPDRVPVFAEIRESLPDQYASTSKLVDSTLVGTLGRELKSSDPLTGEEIPEVSSAKAMMHNDRFQAFAEFVLESAVFGLVGESAAGDWHVL